MSERDLILVSVGICVDGSKSNQSFPHEVNNPMDKTIDKNYVMFSYVVVFVVKIDVETKSNGF